MGIQSIEDIVVRLRKRAEIRRQIATRKSVQEGKPDRIADLLEEAANEIEQHRQASAESDTAVNTRPIERYGPIEKSMVRAKFKVHKIESFAEPRNTGTVYMAPVYGKTGGDGEENSIFGKYTPSGQVQMNIQNPEAFKEFELGGCYYVDFTKAPE